MIHLSDFVVDRKRFYKHVIYDHVFYGDLALIIVYYLMNDTTIVSNTLPCILYFCMTSSSCVSVPRQNITISLVQ